MILKLQYRIKSSAIPYSSSVRSSFERFCRWDAEGELTPTSVDEILMGLASQVYTCMAILYSV